MVSTGLILLSITKFLIESFSLEKLETENKTDLHSLQNNISRLLQRDVDIVGKGLVKHLTSLVQRSVEQQLALIQRVNTLEGVSTKQQLCLSKFEHELYLLTQSTSNEKADQDPEKLHSTRESDASQEKEVTQSESFILSDDFPILDKPQKENPVANFDPQICKQTNDNRKKDGGASMDTTNIGLNSKNRRLPRPWQSSSHNIGLNHDNRRPPRPQQSSRKEVSTSPNNEPLKYQHGLATSSHEEQGNENPVKVSIVHDSVLKRVHGGKLGNGYGCNVRKEVAYTLEDAEHSLNQINNLEKNAKPEAVVVHVGINDLKRSDEKKSAKKCVQIITKFAKENPKIKVIYSKVTPTKKVEINKKKTHFQYPSHYWHM